MKTVIAVCSFFLLAGCSKKAEKPLKIQEMTPAKNLYSGLMGAELDPFVSVEEMSLEEVQGLLSKMHEADQKYRDSLNTKPAGREQYYLQKMAENDQANLKLLDKIVHQFGWPEIRTFGENGAETAWLIIWHHRGRRSVLCKYYDLMEAAVKKGQMNANYFNQVGDEIAKLSPDQIEY